MSARAIQDQKAIAPETFVLQAVQGKAVVPAGAHQGNTIASIEMRPDYVLDNAEKKQLGKALDGAFAQGNAGKFFGSLQQLEILAQRQSRRIAFKVKTESSSWIQPLQTVFEVRL